MALVDVSGVRVLRVPGEETRKKWDELSAKFKEHLQGTSIEQFLEFPPEVVQNANLPEKETFLQLYRDAGCGFRDHFKFEITFECREPGIPDELEWKLVYVGSAADEKLDQELDSVLVGPVNVGRSKFVFQAPPPNPEMVPDKDLLDVTVLLLTCSYKDQEFIRIGYYVNNDFGFNTQLVENPPGQVRPHLSSIRREIVNRESPRVTRFQINWTDPGKPLSAPELQLPQPQDAEDIGMEEDLDEEEESEEEEEEGDDDEEVDLDDEGSPMADEV